MGDAPQRSLRTCGAASGPGAAAQARAPVQHRLQAHPRLQRLLPALTQPNVELVTDAIDHIDARTIVTRDGRSREVDTIILGTGFHVTGPPTAALVRGRDGRTLVECATDEGGIRAYLGRRSRAFRTSSS